MISGEPLSIVRVDQPSLWAVISASTIRALGGNANGQPVHAALIHLVWGLIGRNTFVLRFTSVLFGVCSLALAYKAGEFLFDRRVGLVTALLLALFPLHLRYAQTFRFYALLVTFTLDTDSPPAPPAGVMPDEQPWA